MAKKLEVKKEMKELKKKSSGFIGEFKSFVLRGNVVDMAIGVIIGTAFADIVNALTADFINPIIGLLGGADVAGEVVIKTLSDGSKVSLNYGHFITQVINFVIMAFVLFLILKVFNGIVNAGKKITHEDEKAEDVKEVVPEKSEDVKLLEEIRDLLKKQNKSSK